MGTIIGDIINDGITGAAVGAVYEWVAVSSILGIEQIKRSGSPASEVGGEPVLAAEAFGESCKIEVYFGDAERLFSRAEPTDLCLIDPFPGMKYDRIVEACRVCGEVVVV